MALMAVAVGLDKSRSQQILNFSAVVGPYTGQYLNYVTTKLRMLYKIINLNTVIRKYIAKYHWTPSFWYYVYMDLQILLNLVYLPSF